jgi:Zn-dependent protease/CBS domain-containing protein
MRSFRVGSLFGIPIELDLTFLLVLPVFAWLIANQLEVTAGWLEQLFGVTVATDPLQTGSMAFVVGFAAAVGLFVGVVLHELGHSVVAQRYGYPIDSIRLWIFGGIARLSEMPEDWRQELYIAVAGPVVSVLVGVACYLAFVSTPTSLPAVQFVLGYLALINVVLAGFNLLPAFPMDGGRVLRALLARNRPYTAATKTASDVGKASAILMGLFGLGTGQWLLIGVALFVYIAASREAQSVLMRAAFQGVTVGQIMTPAERLRTVDPETSVADLVERMFQERHTGYPVLQNGELDGLVTLSDAKEIAPVERDAYRVEDVMTRDLTTVAPDADALTAIEAMQSNGIGRLPVVDSRGSLVGIVSRSDLMTALDIIQSSGSLDRTIDPAS